MYLALYYLISFNLLNTPMEDVNTDIIPVFHRRKVRLRLSSLAKVTQVARGAAGM